MTRKIKTMKIGNITVKQAIHQGEPMEFIYSPVDRERIRNTYSYAWHMNSLLLRQLFWQVWYNATGRGLNRISYYEQEIIRYKERPELILQK